MYERFDMKPSDQVPKPTLADVQNLVQTISRDKTKLQAYCKLGKLPDQMQKELKTETILKQSMHLLLRPILSHSK